jgi:hypothetical protein
LNIGTAWAQNTTARTAAQLEQLVAPIALYPDDLLSQVLMASTYPLEVVAAARWSQASPSVTGNALQAAVEKQSWVPSVKALTAVPQTLQMMNDKLEWTQDLGDAFLAQQADVLDAVQRLRARADAAGNLKTTAQQRVTKTSRAAGEITAAAPANVYAIEPTTSGEYSVPIYDPGTVYGTWPYPDYQPFYWYPPGYGGGLYSFARAALAGAAIWATVDWFRNRVQINPSRYNRFNRTHITDRNWTHNPAHRRAVPYRDANVAQRFGNPNRTAAREGFRETANAGRRELGNPGAANRRPTATPRPSAGAIAAGAIGHRPAARPQQALRGTPRATHREAARRPAAGRPSSAQRIGRVGGPRIAHRAAGIRLGGGPRLGASEVVEVSEAGVVSEAVAGDAAAGAAPM